MKAHHGVHEKVLQGFESEALSTRSDDSIRSENGLAFPAGVAAGAASRARSAATAAAMAFGRAIVTA
ncbi:MAG: hypothetical protein AAFW98_03400, partial [Pseudomonadota bacterium]